MIGGVRVVLKTRRDEFAGAATAAHRIVALDDRDLQTGFGQICRADQPIVSAAYNDANVFHRRLPRSSSRTVLNVPSRAKIMSQLAPCDNAAAACNRSRRPSREFLAGRPRRH